MKTFKRHKDYGFWVHDLRLSKISKLGDPLDAGGAYIRIYGNVNE
jgi:hypothetical protein